MNIGSVPASLRDVKFLFVAAAGSGGGASDNDVVPAYPASYDLDNIISVTGTDENDTFITGLWYGLESVDLAAPANQIPQTTPDQTYRMGGATSSASAFVTGVAVLLRTIHPDWSYEQIKTRLLETVDPLPSLNGITVTGGRINALAALQPAAGDFDDNGDIDANDFLLWQRGESPNPLSSIDLAAWELNFGETLSPAVAAVVSTPEPSTLLQASLAGCALLRRRRWV